MGCFSSIFHLPSCPETAPTHTAPFCAHIYLIQFSTGSRSKAQSSKFLSLQDFQIKLEMTRLENWLIFSLILENSSAILQPLLFHTSIFVFFSMNERTPILWNWSFFSSPFTRKIFLSLKLKRRRKERINLSLKLIYLKQLSTGNRSKAQLSKFLSLQDFQAKLELTRLENWLKFFLWFG